MKKLFTLLFIVTSVIANAQVTWDFVTATPTSGVVANSTVSNITQGNNNGTTTLITTTSPSNTYPGFSGSGNAGAAARTGTINTAANGSAYFETTITPALGYKISLTEVSTGSRSTTTAPQLISIRSSIDGYSSDLSTATVANSSAWALVTFSGINLTAGGDVPVTIRLYGSGGTGTPATNTANWRIDDLKISYTSTPSVLPVSISSFTGSYTNNTSLLKWSVGNEININKYAVEHSIDGKIFNEIGFVNAIGNNDYNYTDVNTKATINFYRLRIVGVNETKYSAVVKILSDAFGSKLNVYPSPAVNTVNAEFTSQQKTTANVQLIDAGGKIVLQKNMQIQQGYNNLNFDINTLNKGTYILKMTIGTNAMSAVFNKF